MRKSRSKSYLRRHDAAAADAAYCSRLRLLLLLLRRRRSDSCCVPRPARFTHSTRSRSGRLTAEPRSQPVGRPAALARAASLEEDPLAGGPANCCVANCWPAQASGPPPAPPRPRI